MAQNLLTPSNARYNPDLVLTPILNVRHIFLTAVPVPMALEASSS